MAKRQKTQVTEDSAKDGLLIAFGKKVREARDRAGLTRAQLGEITGLAPSYIFDMESAGANVTLNTLAKIAAALNLGPRDLLPESDRDALTSSGVASLVAALDRATTVLAERQSQEAELVALMQGFCNLRARLKRLTAAAAVK